MRRSLRDRRQSAASGTAQTLWSWLRQVQMPALRCRRDPRSRDVLVKIFTFHKEHLTDVAIAYNRGQAVKLLAKELGNRGLVLTKEDPVEELDLDGRHQRQGYFS